MNRKDTNLQPFDESQLDDLQVADADEVVGAGMAPPSVARPEAEVGHERDGYRAGAGPAGAQVRRRDGAVEYEVQAGDRRAEGRLD